MRKRAGPLVILAQTQGQTRSRIKHARLNSEFVQKLDPPWRRGLLIFSSYAGAAMPSVERWEIAVSLEAGHPAIAPFEKIVQLGVLFKDVAIGVYDRIFHSHVFAS